MTIRADAYQSLPPTEEVAALRDRHAEFFRTFARRARDAEFSRERDMWIELLESELDNVRAALSWALEQRDSEGAMDLSASCLRIWQDGRYTEGRSWLGRALAIDPSPTPERVRALLAATDVADFTTRLTLADEALTAARVVDEPRLLVGALRTIGWAQYNRALTEDAVVSFDEAIAVGRGMIPPPAETADALRGLGWMLLEGRGEAARATELHEEARQLVTRPGLEGPLVAHLGEHANLLHQVGDLAGAEALYEAKLELESDPGLARTRWTTLLNLADVKSARGNRQEARELWTQVFAGAELAGNSGNALRALVRLAGFDLLEGDLDSARGRLEAATLLVDDLPDAMDLFHNNLPLLLWLRSELAQHDGDVTRAKQLFERRMALFQGRPFSRGSARLPVARLASRCGENERAVALVREAVELVGTEPALEAQILRVRGVLAEMEGDLDLAWELQLESRSRRHDAAFPNDLAMAAGELARLAILRRDPAAVRDLVAEGLPPARASFLTEEIVLLHLLAQAELLDGDPHKARQVLEEALPRWTEVGGATDWVVLVETFCRTSIGADRVERGAELLGLADAERERIVFPRTEQDRADIEVAATAARAALGDEAFEAARGRGRAMDIRTELWKEAGR